MAASVHETTVEVLGRVSTHLKVVTRPQEHGRDQTTIKTGSLPEPIRRTTLRSIELMVADVVVLVVSQAPQIDCIVHQDG